MEQKLPNKIRRPRLQRDYVQGLNPSVIVPFVAALLGKSPIHLHYIYGSQPSEKMGFEPVDGQQRLTTLWLLRLCLSKMARQPFTDELTFSACEYADSFCRALMQATAEDLKEPQKAKGFIKAWGTDTSVKAMMATIKVIHDKLQRDQDSAEILEGLENRVEFCLLPLDDNINEDIDIKMNRRGLALTRFEMLKSWLDEEADEAWKQAMDGRWSDMAWDITAKPSAEEREELPENGKLLTTDDAMLSALYCFVHIYWAKAGKEAFDKAINEMSLEESDIRAALSIAPDADIYNHVMAVLIKPTHQKRIDLYQMDVLPLLSDAARAFVKTSMDRLASAYKRISESGVFFGAKSKGQHVVDYLLSGNSYRSRAILYAATAKFEPEYKGYEAWLRRTRHLLLNTEINKENFALVCKGIDQLQAYVCRVSLATVFTAKADESKDLYPVEGFSRRQLQEEARKSQLPADASAEVKALENHPFFAGRVNFLFDFVGDNPTINKLRSYLHYMSLMFDANSFAQKVGNPLRQAMLSFGWFGYPKGRNWDFLNAKEEKKKFVCDNKPCKRQGPDAEGHNTILKKVIDELYHNYGVSIKTAEALSRALLELSAKRYKTIPPNDSRRYFDRITSWNYMELHQMRDEDAQEMMLLKRMQRNGAHINLFVHRLYLDWSKESKDKFSGCACKLYQAENTCLYFEKKVKIKGDGSEKIMAIDISHAIGQQERFNIAVFIRSDRENTQSLFAKLADKEGENPRYKWNDDDRYVSCATYSPEALIQELNALHRLI